MKIVIKLVVLAVSTASMAFAALIDLSKTGPVAQVGDLFWINLSVGGLTSSPLDSISGFDVDLTFDPTVLKYTQVSFVDPGSARNELSLPGGVLPFFGEVTESSSGRLDLVGVSGNTALQLDAEQADAFAFVRVQFQLLTATSSLVSLDLMDPNLLFSNSASGPADLQFRTPSVSIEVGGVSAVPEASAASLIPVVVAALVAGRAWRRSRERNARSAVLLRKSE